MRRAGAAQHWGVVADLDMRFHLAVVDAAGSARLSRMYGMLIDETRSLLSMTASYPGREDLVHEHAELSRFLEAGDLAWGHRRVVAAFRDVASDTPTAPSRRSANIGSSGPDA